MAENEARKRRLEQDANSKYVKKLKAAANIAPQHHVERLDWMYEQTPLKKDEEIDLDLMNTAVKDEKDKDIEKVHQLRDSVAGSLFLQSATSVSNDMLRKLREDPLFQIRQAELKRKESLLSNPLLRQRQLKKHQFEIQKYKEKKEEKKQEKKKKKERRKEKKKKKLKKKKKKKRSKSSSSSSSVSSSSSSSGTLSDDPKKIDDRSGDKCDRRNRSQSRHLGDQKRLNSLSPSSRQKKAKDNDRSFFSPSEGMIRTNHDRWMKRKEEEALKAKARGGGIKGFSDKDKQVRLKEMMADGLRHETFKDKQAIDHQDKEKKMEKLEEEWRKNSDRTVFKKMNESTYMKGDVSVADRVKSNRHRRQKGLHDPLEK